MLGYIRSHPGLHAVCGAAGWSLLHAVTFKPDDINPSAFPNMQFIAHTVEDGCAPEVRLRI